MGHQFDRVYRLLVGVQGSDGIIVEGKPKQNALNIAFDIDKDLTKQTNKCSLQVFNLSEKTAKVFERDDSICILEAGYSEDIGLRRIFVGAVLKAWSYKKGADKITELELSDGQIAIRDCVVSLSYAENVSGQKVINDVAASMGLVVQYADGIAFNSYANGFSFIGPGRTCLEKVCAASGLSWSIQNNVLQIIENGGSTKVEAIKLNADSGLIGSPQRIVKSAKKIKKQANKKRVKSTKNKDKKAGWRIRSLLQPTLNPGDLIYVESQTVTGWFKVESLKHKGEYRSKNWYTDMEIYEIGGESKNEH